MYERHFGLRTRPFSLAPDPSFLYLSEGHATALSLLQYAVGQEAGFAVITGEVGSGKTILIHSLLERLDAGTVTGVVSNTHRDFGSLMQWILLALGVRVRPRGRIAQHAALVEFLSAQAAAGRRTVLIVDEAQNLTAGMLEELRLLSNVNSGSAMLLQTILAGQPELRQKLRGFRLRQFAQRVVADYHLAALPSAETAAYIHHRVRIAGGDPKLFDAAAVDLLRDASGGIPRVLNSLCDTSLVYAYADQSTAVDRETVRQVVADRRRGGLLGTPRGDLLAVAAE